ncbi:MAG: hypothetical protein LH606_08345, partial [Cytophagaceae bacterium]|nr:hypothetical protein [Cytophagaceae bacterium]
ARTLQELLEPLGLRFKKIRTRSYAISPIKADTDEKPQSNAVPFVGAAIFPNKYSIIKVSV